MATPPRSASAPVSAVGSAAHQATALAVAAALTPVIIGPTIDKLYDLRERKRALEASIKEIEEEYTDLEERLLEKLEAEGSDKGAGKTASVSVTRNVVGNVTDWEKFNAYVKKTGFFHLFQRRLSDAAVRELFEQGKKIPGCEPFTKRRLNVRVLG
jgi:hypothetical protein